MSDRPFCAEQPGQVAGSPISDLLWLIGILGTIVGVFAWAKDASSAAPTFQIAGIGSIPLAAVAGAGAVLFVTGYMLYNRCWPRDGGIRCWAGVVNNITESFDTAWDVVFPSGAMHPRVDVVVKERFWPLVTQGAGFVHCSLAPADIGSPLIMTFYKSKAVCGAAAGAMFGAAVGVGATVALALAVGAIACTGFPFLCLVALLVAALIGAIITLICAAAGGAIGRALGGDDAPHATGGADIALGQLITVSGKLITMEEFDLANVGWWGHGTAIHGSVATPGPYSDVEAAQLATDSCSPREAPGSEPTGAPAGGPPPDDPPAAPASDPPEIEIK